ncbi:BTB/POZ and MATH domain-containing protein 2 [Hordeum vulgare]|nr:BTB/POZ and MATH domain-containing protein 2 [Hordeum vulgare]
MRADLERLGHVSSDDGGFSLHDLGQLLSSGEGADVTFEVSGETFAAHRCILGARSFVFRAELLGPMKESTSTCVQIEDMEPKVFKALLHFIYTDSLPEIDEAEALEMIQHLLVAADRYGLKRLKLTCEEKLCSYINTTTVATTLALSEQHACPALKEECLRFLESSNNSTLDLITRSSDFEHLATSCPSIMKELIPKLARKPPFVINYSNM